MEEPINILIVDDESRNLTVLETILDDPGYRLVRAESADQALLALVVDEFALLILDIRMPGMTGFELAQMIKERKKTALVPIIFLTAYDNEGQHVFEGYNRGAVDYLHKPVSPAILRAKVAIFAELHRKNRRADQELATQQTQLKGVIASAMDAIITVNERERVVVFNQAAESMFLCQNADAIGQPLARFIPERFRQEHSAHMHAFTATQQATSRSMGQSRALFGLRANGEEFPIEASISHAQVDGKSLLTVILRDVTERKQLEEQLRQAQKMDAVGRLAGGVAHDFNNLLTIINGYSALLIDRLSGEDPRREMVVETLKAGERASELTKQLLAFSRKQVLMPQPLNFNDSLRLISSMLSRLLGEEVTLTMDLAPDLWSINGDKGQLNQVTMNLAINARDAMPDGGTLMIATRNVSVTTERPGHHRMMPPGDYVHVSVHDTGHGMSPETLSHLFEPFFTTKEVGQGTGLGLATVYGIVKQSQGYIFADSTLDQGSTFHLYYPRVIAAPAMAEIPPVRHRKGSERLLVIEDQDSVRALIVQALKQDGYHVVEAANGEEALQAAASLLEPIQALVTDVIMPQMSGLVVAERLRVIWPGIRVLFMSGYVDLTKPAFLDKPGTAFIQKPFLPDELARHLRDLLDRSI
jgi:two-component system, cell cycle sensor histidine kinase and response regulator CckA